MTKETWKAGNMIYPLPAVMVSAADKEGNQNIITIAWTGTVCTNPAMLYISVRPEREPYDEGSGLCDRLVRREVRQGCR